VTTGPVGVGIIGAGMISDFYLENLTRFPDTNVLAIADIDLDRAKAAAEKWNVPSVGATEDLLADPDIEIVLNLTIPAAHASVSTTALEAGKHVWSEKPITVDRESAQRLVDLARERNLLLGIAPDTLLGRGWQTAMRAIRSGAIGTPQTAVTSFQWQGPDWFHLNPEFLFAQGGVLLLSAGPLVGSDRQGRCYRPYRNDQAPDPRRTSGGHRIPGGGAHTRLGSHRIRAGWSSADSAQFRYRAVPPWRLRNQRQRRHDDPPGPQPVRRQGSHRPTAAKG
jgi:hypothetical protein